MSLQTLSTVPTSLSARIDLSGPWGVHHGLSVVNVNITNLCCDAYVVPHPFGFASYQGIPAEVARTGGLPGIQAYADYVTDSTVKPSDGDYFITDSGGGGSLKLANIAFGFGGTDERNAIELDVGVSNALASGMLLHMDSMAMPPMGVTALGAERSARVMFDSMRTFWMYNPHYCPRHIIIATSDADTFDTFAGVGREVFSPPRKAGLFSGLSAPRFVVSEGRRLADLFKHLPGSEDALDTLAQIGEIATRNPSLFRVKDIEALYLFANANRPIRQDHRFLFILEHLLRNTEGAVSSAAGRTLARIGREITRSYEDAFRFNISARRDRENVLRERLERVLPVSMSFKPFLTVLSAESDIISSYDGITMDGMVGRMKIDGIDAFMRFVRDKSGNDRAYIIYMRVNSETYASEIFERLIQGMPTTSRHFVKRIIGEVGRSDLPDVLGGVLMTIAFDQGRTRAWHAANFYRHLVDNMGLEFGRFRT